MHVIVSYIFSLTVKRSVMIISPHRVLGWGCLVELVANEWAQDIKKYQLPRILKGVGPMYHVTQLGEGYKMYMTYSGPSII